MALFTPTTCPPTALPLPTHLERSWTTWLAVNIEDSSAPITITDLKRCYIHAYLAAETHLMTLIDVTDSVIKDVCTAG